MSRTARCGKCKNTTDFPLFKVPLGPPVFEDRDGEAAAAGLDIKAGVVHYAWMCLICTQAYVKNMVEDDLRN